MVPLHIAAKNGWLEIVECLVGKEAESVVNIKDNDGVSVQDYIPQVMLSWLWVSLVPGNSWTFTWFMHTKWIPKCKKWNLSILKIVYKSVNIYCLKKRWPAFRLWSFRWAEVIEHCVESLIEWVGTLASCLPYHLSNDGWNIGVQIILMHQIEWKQKLQILTAHQSMHRTWS